MNWWILEVSLGINNVLCNNKRYIRGFGFPFYCSNDHLFYPPSDWNSTPWNFIVNSTPRTLRELLPPFSPVASLQLSLVLGRVASLLSYSSPPPDGGPLPRTSSLVNGSVAVSGNRRSSGPGGPAARYCTISCQHCWVRSACRKVMTSFRSSLPRTSRVVTVVSRVSLPSLGYSYLHSPWRQPRAPRPSSPPPLGGTSFGRVLVLHYLGSSGWTWTWCNAGWPIVYGNLPPLVFIVLGFLMGFQEFLLCLFGTRLRFSFCFLPISLIYFFTCASVSL